jgi:hypothetical protein
MRKSVASLARGAAALALVAGLVAMSACGSEPMKGGAGRDAGTSEKEAPPYAPEVAEENAANYAPGTGLIGEEQILGGTDTSELDPAASQGCCILWSSISIV